MDLFNATSPFQWKCPVCAHAVIIGDSSFQRQDIVLTTEKSPEGQRAIIGGMLIHCPNGTCGSNFVAVRASWGQRKLVNSVFRVVHTQPIGIGTFVFAPATPEPLSPTVPQFVKDDYNEAYLIRSLSPKASATLSRRALQGMLRDRWHVAEKTLHAELVAVKDRCDSDLYDAMMALKAIGNIGAHPEKDADAMLDIDDDEADELLQLLKLLDDEWYVARARRAKTIAAVVEMKDRKELAKGAPHPAANA
ncbi:DUF4145 domain-containing protein [Achromobacter animicus]|uniref:DUF4145 domain-containing protein n=1 Tax=Achromobacter animicus TaxID=1389935 RepID=UPI00345E13BC